MVADAIIVHLYNYKHFQGSFLKLFRKITQTLQDGIYI